MLSFFFIFLSVLACLFVVEGIALLFLKKFFERAKKTSETFSLEHSDEQILENRETVKETQPLENCEWLNKIFERIFLSLKDSKAAKQSIINSFNNEFSEIQRKHKIIEKFVVKSFDFGQCAPEIRTVTLFKTEDHSISDLNLNASISYVGQLSLGIELSLSLPATLLNLTVTVTIEEIIAKLRVRLFNTDNPYISIYLLEDPIMSFVVEFLVGEKEKYKNLVDQAIKKIFKIVINKALVTPNGKTFPLNPPKETIKKKKKIIAKLEITLIEANDLAAADKNGLSDPYCIIKSGRQERKTKIIPKTLNPKWNQTFILDIYESTSEIALEVFDHDKLSKDDYLGTALVSVDPTFGDEAVQHTEILQNKARQETIKVKGSITFSTKYYEPTTSTSQLKTKTKTLDKKNSTISLTMIGVEVKEAHNLFASDRNGFSDPYCVVHIGSKSKRTKIIQKNLNPKWNQKFTFSVDDPNAKIKFEVWDWDFGSKDDFLGQYTIPISSIERDNLLNKVCSLSPRIEHPEETYVQGEIVVSLVNEKIPASTKNDWIKRFMGDKFEPLKAKSESDDEFVDVADIINEVPKTRQSNSSNEIPPLYPKIDTNELETGSTYSSDSPNFQDASDQIKSASLKKVLALRNMSMGSVSDRNSISSSVAATSFQSSTISSNSSTSGKSILLQGSITKYSTGLIKKWKPRYYQLRETAFVWGSDEKKFSKSLKFAEVTIIEPVLESKFKKKYVFKIATKKKTSYFQAVNEAEFTTLVEYLKKILNPAI